MAASLLSFLVVELRQQPGLKVGDHLFDDQPQWLRRKTIDGLS